jgi:hypothetical protein
MNESNNKRNKVYRRWFTFLHTDGVKVRFSQPAEESRKDARIDGCSDVSREHGPNFCQFETGDLEAESH